MPADCHVRDFAESDTIELYKIFYSAVHLLTVTEYTQAQRNAWAPPQFDHNSWRARFMANSPFLVECPLGGLQQVAGFADLQTSGYIDMFYVSQLFARTGIASLLMDEIHRRAKLLNIAVLTSDVRLAAQTFLSGAASRLIGSSR